MKNNVMLVIAGGLLCCAVFLCAPKASDRACQSRNNSLSACSCGRPRPVQPPQVQKSTQTNVKLAVCPCQRPRPTQPTQPTSVDPYNNG